MPRKKQTKDDYSFSIEKLIEYPDGSCDVSINMSNEVMRRLIEAGVMSILKEHINQTYYKLPWYKRIFLRKQVHINKESN